MLSRRFYKFLSIFLIVCFVVYIPIFALDRLIVNKPNHPVSLAIKDKFKQPEEWRTYTSRRGKFTVLLPGGYPKVWKKIASANRRSTTLHFFQVNRSGPISYMVSYYDLPALPKNADEIILTMSNAKNADAIRETLSTQAIKLGQIHGRETFFRETLKKNSHTFMLRYRVYLKGRRLYGLCVTTLTQDKFREESDKFMESFEIIN